MQGTKPIPVLAPSELAEFEALTEKTTGCWIWKGDHFSNATGAFYIDGEAFNAYRVAYEIKNGTGSASMKVIGHTCHNRCCINPDHLKVKRVIGESSAKRSTGGKPGRPARVNPDMILCRLPEDGSEIPQKWIVNEIAQSHSISKRPIYDLLKKMVEDSAISQRTVKKGVIQTSFIQRK